jgi:ribosomal protein S18 acetylase RimI-like enzyme
MDLTTWYLEMRHPDELRGRAVPEGDITVMRAAIPSPAFSRFLYTAVGADWHWTERLNWDDDRWQRYLARPEVETWVAYLSGTPAGYLELEAQRDGDVEIVYFGLLPGFIGRGLGGYHLTVGVQRAWAMGARRVWLHTCSLDGPHALANYQARGFRIYRSETIPRAPGHPDDQGMNPLARRDEAPTGLLKADDSAGLG